MNQIKVLFPFKDGEEIWLGLDTLGFRRKVIQTVDKKLVNSEHIVAGLTVFESSETSAWHNHPESEEVDTLIRGFGTLIDDGKEEPFKEGEWMFIPTGAFHNIKSPATSRFG